MSTIHSCKQAHEAHVGSSITALSQLWSAPGVSRRGKVKQQGAQKDGQPDLTCRHVVEPELCSGREKGNKI